MIRYNKLLINKKNKEKVQVTLSDCIGGGQR